MEKNSELIHNAPSQWFRVSLLLLLLLLLLIYISGCN
jgi:hypothetical protein